MVGSITSLAGAAQTPSLRFALAVEGLDKDFTLPIWITGQRGVVIVSRHDWYRHFFASDRHGHFARNSGKGVAPLVGRFPIRLRLRVLFPEFEGETKHW